MRWLIVFLSLVPATGWAELHVAIVQGLGGTSEYQADFAAQVETLQKSTQRLTGATRVRTFLGDNARREQLLEHLKSFEQLGGDDRIAVFLVGHGSYDGFE